MSDATVRRLDHRPARAQMGDPVSPSARVLGMAASALVAGLILAFALWYTSAGLFPKFPGIQNDYVDLGTAFLQGQLSLLEQPDPRLADLGDPYEYTQRKGLPYHWDASYYDGRYYLYWGPAPGLVSAALQALTGQPPSASLLVVLPFTGLMIVAASLLWILAQAFDERYRLTVWLFIVVLFFNLPMLVTIGQPRHYQTSILWGQFFLLLGVLGVAQHLRGRSVVWLAIAGLAWGLAVASRYNLAISLAAYGGCLALWIWSNGYRSYVRRLIVLLIPLALCLLGLGLYNLVRFGDPMETGLRYQLTIPEFREISYSAAYIPSGLYIYLLYPLTGAPSFPFIQSAHFRPNLLPDSLFIPDGREFDQITLGLLPTVPAVSLLAILLPLIIGWMATPRGHRSLAAPSTGSRLIISMLAVGAAGQFLFILAFFYVAERYIPDFYVPLIICLAVVVWSADAAVRGRPALRAGLWIAVVILTAWSAGIGYFACFGVPVLVSLYYDPAMLMRLAGFWNALYGSLGLILPGTR